MTPADWARAVRDHLAVAAVGPSTLMKQSGKGRLKAARKFLLEQVPLDDLAVMKEGQFAAFLDDRTSALARKLPRPDDGEPNWGAARKVINIFLRMCAMNKDVSRAYKLKHVEPFLEVPLDGQTVEGIDSEGDTSYSSTFKIKTLDRQLSKSIQDSAMTIATKRKLHRYELDVLFWNREQRDE